MHADNFAFCFQLILDFDRISLCCRRNRGRGRGRRAREARKNEGDTMWPKALATSTEVTVQFELEMYLMTQNAILRRNMSALYTDKLKSAHFSPINYLTIIPQVRMGYESIPHEAEGRMGY